MALHDANPLGTDATECASKPELMLDLALADLSKRVVLCHGLTTLLGPTAIDKLESRWVGVRESILKLRAATSPEYNANNICKVAANSLRDVNELHSSILSLIVEAVRRDLKRSERVVL